MPPTNVTPPKNIPKERIFSPAEIKELNALQDAQHRTK
jgi:hypothetical protein